MKKRFQAKREFETRAQPRKNKRATGRRTKFKLRLKSRG